MAQGESSFPVGELVHQLIPSTQASGTDLELSFLAIDRHSGALNIRQPAPSGVAFGVAHIVPELTGLSAEFTLCHNFMLL